MAWLYEKSATWRKIIAVTRQSPLAMAAFTASCFAVPYFGGEAILHATNPEIKQGQDVKARETLSMHEKAMARVNRERLAVLLEEAKRGSSSSNERYAAALSFVQGRELGDTHWRYHGGGQGSKNIWQSRFMTMAPLSLPFEKFFSSGEAGG